MLRFIDIATGNTYDGECPYIHYFDNQQSVNLYYVKQICFISTSQTCKVSMPENEVFTLANLTSNTNETNAISANAETIDHFTLIDKDKTFLRNKKNQVPLLTNELTLAGYASNYGYIYMLYIVGSSSSAGEFHETVTIKENNKTEHTVEVAADFTPADETIVNALTNMGTEIPEGIQNAIYESDVREDATDTVMLNRKWKELLFNYLDIVGNKGNYKSLERSLNWFEYGDLLKISEYWHKNEAGREFLNKRDLTKVVDDKIKSLMTTLWKTTYIGITMPLNKIQHAEFGWTEYEEQESDAMAIRDEEGNLLTRLHPAYLDQKIKNAEEAYDRHTMIGGGKGDFGISDWKQHGKASQYEGMEQSGANLWRDESYARKMLAEPIPNLYKCSFMWSRDILMLKTALVAKYFSRYFMPIHLNLLESTVEELIYTNTVKLTYDSNIRRDDTVGQFLAAEMQCADKIYLSNEVLFVRETTPFSEVVDKGDTDEFSKILGVERASDITVTNNVVPNGTIINTVSAVLDVNLKMKLADNEYIKHCEIELAYPNVLTKRAAWDCNKLSNITTAEDGTTNVPFKIAVFKGGNAILFVSAITNNCNIYTATKNLTIVDNVNNAIELCKIRRYRYSQLLYLINKEHPTEDGSSAYETMFDTDEILHNNDFIHYMFSSTPQRYTKYYFLFDTEAYKKLSDQDVYKFSSDWIDITHTSANLPAVVERTMSINDMQSIIPHDNPDADKIIYNLFKDSNVNYSITNDNYKDKAQICWQFEIYLDGNVANVTVKYKTGGGFDDYYSNAKIERVVTVPDIQHPMVCTITDDFTSNINSVGLNRVLRIKYTDETAENIAALCANEHFKNHYWFQDDIEAINEETGEVERYFVAVCKFYSINEENLGQFYEKTFELAASDGTISKLNVTAGWDPYQTSIYKQQININITKDSDALKVFNSVVTVGGEMLYQNTDEDNNISFKTTAISTLLYSNDAFPFKYEFDVEHDGKISHKVIELNITAFDYECTNGTEANRSLDNVRRYEKIEGQNMPISHNVMEELAPYIEQDTDMFIPLLNTYETLDSYTVSRADVICIKPLLKHVALGTEYIQWQFINATTGVTYVPHASNSEVVGALQEPFFQDNLSAALPNGVYSIQLTYGMNGESKTTIFKNLLQVKN